jgi:23S rRNA (guanosine2251-2'-O)-methyltransferase
MKIYGKNPVLERLKANPKSIRVIFVEAGHPEHGYIARKAKQHGISISVVDARRMMKLGRSLNTQGLMMEVEDFGYMPFDDVLDEAVDKGIVPVFCDGLTDPQNLGAIMRSLACLGGFTLVLPTHDSVHVTEAVLRVACGGDNYVRACRVNNLNQAILKAQERGLTVVGSVVKEGQDIRTTRLAFPLALVIGSEDQGIRDVVVKRLDMKISVPMAHPRMSLNAGHAASIFCYEISKQRPQYVSRKKEVAPKEEVVSDDLTE